MAKDVIYIDVEDDITTIVGKIKASKEKIIALVPPARIGVLQSAVNMRLLQRTAELAKKRVVLISNNQSLAMLAAAAQIPVAKNLQSKPELAEIPVLKVDGDDIIDGESLPVGELERSTEDKAVDRAVDDVAKSNQATTTTDTTRRKKKTQKVPNFSTFRKKILLIGGGVALFIGFLVWAIWFAPKATVIISAKTTSVTIDKGISLKTEGAADVEKGILGAIKKEEKKEITTEFTATGKKQVGEKATGSVRIEISPITILKSGLNVPAGTKVTSSSGMSYSTTSAAAFAKGDEAALDGVVVGVIAADIGTNYNGATGAASTSAAGVMSVTFVNSPTGGSSREVTVVSQEDVNKATEKLKEQKDTTLQSKINESLKGTGVAITESYQENYSDPTPSVAIDAEATGPVTLKATLAASMIAVDQADLQNFIKNNVKAEIGDKKAQKIYEDGADKAKFAQFINGDNMTVRVTANATVGPEVNEAEVKQQVKGKSYGDIQASLEAIEGVDDVDTKFSPFWVRKVPNDEKRITIEFKLQDAS